jgi:hypothetical protein
MRIFFLYAGGLVGALDASIVLAYFLDIYVLEWWVSAIITFSPILQISISSQYASFFPCFWLLGATVTNTEIRMFPEWSCDLQPSIISKWYTITFFFPLPVPCPNTIIKTKRVKNPQAKNQEVTKMVLLCRKNDEVMSR